MPPFSREGVQLVAFVNGTESPAFKVLRVDKSVGANQLDHAVVRVDFGTPGSNLYVQDLDMRTLDLDLPNVFFNSVQGAHVRIVSRTSAGDADIFWGKSTVQEIDCGDSESITLVARLEHGHFGAPTQFQIVVDPINGGWTSADHYIVFNPEVDGGIVGNRNPNLDSRFNGHDVFVDPRSIETADGAAIHGVTEYHDPSDPDEINEVSDRNWNLREAVLYLCGACNPSETYITNPAEGDLPNVLPDDRALLKNLVIPPGLYLPEALDRLLNPFGYYWYIEYQGADIRKIRIFRAGVGVERTLKWQAPGSVFNPAETNTSQVKLTYDASMAVNQVRAYGDFLQVESTWDLIPAWDADQDSLTISDLNKSLPDWDEHPERHRVWRDWVLDEASDYPREWGGSNAPDGSDFRRIFINIVFQDAFEGKTVEVFTVVPKRKKFLPMLTRGPDGKPYGEVGGCVVEWYDPEKEGGPGWVTIDKNIEFFSCQLLQDECGIRFTGSVPPVFIMQQGSNARVRITATIKSDIRMMYLASRQDTSVNHDVNEVVLDVGQHFHARAVGISYHDNKGFGADESDGWVALEDFAEAARAAFDQVQCSGNAVLEGLDHREYTLGDLITKVQGREIGLALNISGESVAYPQIVGISYDAQAQKTVLTLNEFKDTTAWVAAYLRKTKRLK